MNDGLLTGLQSAGVVSFLDVHFAGFLNVLDGVDRAGLVLAAALVSSYTRQGHICLGLEQIGGKPLESAPELGPLPDPAAWRRELSGAKVVGGPGDYRPLILDASGRLYLHRYWEYQQKLADSLRARINQHPILPPFAAPREALDRLFPTTGEVDWQKIAAFAGTSRMFCVISGGPGTGKTSTIARILALLLTGSSQPRIALTAPTGKAAARLQEAIKASKPGLVRIGCDVNAIPESASTIHRLLGTIRGSPYFRHNEQNPLAVDVLVIDEASMVDLALMSKLVQALPSKARLILLGDKDQLSSVEAGAVLGDICDIGGPLRFTTEFAGICKDLCGCALDTRFIYDGNGPEPRDCIIELQKNHRFTSESGIAALGNAVRKRDTDAAVSILRSGTYPDLAWLGAPSGNALGKAIRTEVLGGLAAYSNAVNAFRRSPEEGLDGRLQEIFDRFERFRILVAVRGGPWGVDALNHLVEGILADARLLDTNRKWYPGRPVIVGQNDYNLRLFNGDIGICLPGIRSGSDAMVFFPGQEGTYRSFHPMRLPEHETVYAMTVHKSQGSEFRNVLMVLPDRDSPVLTRELVYTGITRAREHLLLLSSGQILRMAITRSAERLSGLSESLWGGKKL